MRRVVWGLIPSVWGREVRLSKGIFRIFSLFLPANFWFVLCPHTGSLQGQMMMDADAASDRDVANNKPTKPSPGTLRFLVFEKRNFLPPLRHLPLTPLQISCYVPGFWWNHFLRVLVPCITICCSRRIPPDSVVELTGSLLTSLPIKLQFRIVEVKRRDSGSQIATTGRSQ